MPGRDGRAGVTLVSLQSAKIGQNAKKASAYIHFVSASVQKRLGGPRTGDWEPVSTGGDCGAMCLRLLGLRRLWRGVTRSAVALTGERGSAGLVARNRGISVCLR